MTGWARALWMPLLLGGAVWLAAPAVARGEPESVALIETTVPLEDSSEEGIAAAVSRALENAVRGAAAMGLNWVQLRRAYRAGDHIGVQVLAATEALDTGTDEETAPAPDESRRSGATPTRL